MGCGGLQLLAQNICSLCQLDGHRLGVVLCAPRNHWVLTGACEESCIYVLYLSLTWLQARVPPGGRKLSFSSFRSFPAPLRVQARPWGLVQDRAARVAPSDARHLSVLVTTTMPLVAAPDPRFAPRGLSGPAFSPQVHPADVLQGPPSHQHHHHLPQRGPLHPAQDHPQVSCPSWSVSPPAPAPGEGQPVCLLGVLAL